MGDAATIAKDASDRFKVQPSNYLGEQFEAFRENQYAEALANPTQYYKKRAAVMARIKGKMVDELYSNIFLMLTEGDPTIVDNGGNGNTFIPNYPAQDANNVALKIFKNILSQLNEVVNILLPNDYRLVAARNLESHASHPHVVHDNIAPLKSTLGGSSTAGESK
jgi:hypothetical protein